MNVLNTLLTALDDASQAHLKAAEAILQGVATEAKDRFGSSSLQVVFDPSDISDSEVNLLGDGPSRSLWDLDERLARAVVEAASAVSHHKAAGCITVAA